MRILIGNKGNVDFDEPIIMSINQKKEFIKFMKKMFAVVIEENREYFRTKRLGEMIFQKEWTDKERAVLLKIKNTQEISEQLGRSYMSVNFKRGWFLPEFFNWADINGYDILEGDIEKLIKQFLNERDEKKLARRRAKKEERNEIPNLEKKREKLEDLLRKLNYNKKFGIENNIEHDKIIPETEEKLKQINDEIILKTNR